MSRAIITESLLTDIADAIRGKNLSTDEYTPAQMAAAITNLPTGITPTGTVNITENGTVDVTQYASAAVAVPNSYAAGDEGKVVSNGALVSQTSRTVTSNGTIDTTTNNSVTVDVAGGSVSNDFNLSENLIPKMTSATAPSGEASASSSINAYFAPYLAFNREEVNSSSMQGGWLAAGNDSAPWIMYNWGESTKIDVIELHTANNSTTYTLTLYIEGLTSADVWENMLRSGETVDITFNYNTYGGTVGKYTIRTNGNNYKAFRIRGTEAFYKGSNHSACTFSSIYAYTLSGQFPGIGYYGIEEPSSALGVNGNVYTNVLSKLVYQKTNGAWALI